jgi:4-hydroxybenzoate polyprenyltransferase
MRAILELLRVTQWVKNGFVFAPLFFGSALFERGAVKQAVLAFTIFCLVSSAVYIFNDWRDIESDRAHLKKGLRPLASGLISVPAALILMCVLLAAAAVLLALSDASAKLIGVIAVYLAINAAYSLGCKHVPVVELFLVSSGFVLRLVAGGIAVNIALSPWIEIATAMIALLITAGKRRGDIQQANDANRTRRSISGYNLAYLDAMLAALTGATLVVYLLFCVSDYATERFGSRVLFTAIPVAFGIMRYVQLIMVKGEGDSPTDLVVRDTGMILTILVFLAMFGALIYF